MWAGGTPPRVPRPGEVRGVQVLARPDLPGPSLPVPDFSGPPRQGRPPQPRPRRWGGPDRSREYRPRMGEQPCLLVSFSLFLVACSSQRICARLCSRSRGDSEDPRNETGLSSRHSQPRMRQGRAEHVLATRSGEATGRSLGTDLGEAAGALARAEGRVKSASKLPLAQGMDPHSTWQQACVRPLGLRGGVQEPGTHHAILPIFSRSFQPQSWEAGVSSPAHFTGEVRRLEGKRLTKVPELRRGARLCTQAWLLPEQERPT